MASVSITGNVTAPGTTNWSISSGTITKVSIGTLVGSSTSGNVTFPAFTEGSFYPAYGSATLTLNDTDNQSITLVPPATLQSITLTSVGVGLGYIGNYFPCTTGDSLIFDLPATLGITNHSISVAGLINTDFSDQFVVWHRRGTDGILTKLMFNDLAITCNLTSLTANSSSPKIDALFPLGNRT